MEAATVASTFDKLRRHTYEAIALAFDDGTTLAATIADVRGEGTSDVSLSLRFDSPQYGHLAKKLGHTLVLSIGDAKFSARLHAIHPESVNIVAITARFK